MADDDLGRSERVQTAMTALRGFVDAVRTLPEMNVSFTEIPPASEDALDAFVAATGRPLPAEVRAFYQQGPFDCLIMGYSPITGHSDTGFAEADFVSLDHIRENMPWWGDLELADMLDEENAKWKPNPGVLLHARHIRFGIPLWQTQHSIVVDSQTGEVGRFDGDAGPSDPIGSHLADFLEHFAAAGMFRYGAASRAYFDVYWDKVRPLVPYAIEPQDNLWLQHLDRQYKGDLTSVV